MFNNNFKSLSFIINENNNLNNKYKNEETDMTKDTESKIKRYHISNINEDARCLNFIKNGQIFQKFDFNHKNIILINNVSSCKSLKYDIIKEKILFSELPSYLFNDYVSGLCFYDFNENIISYALMKKNIIGIYDFNKNTIFCTYDKTNDTNTNTVFLKSNGNTLIDGNCNGDVNIFDIRMKEQIFNIELGMDFNPINKIMVNNMNIFVNSYKNLFKFDLRKPEHIFNIKNNKSIFSICSLNTVNKTLYSSKVGSLEIQEYSYDGKLLNIYDFNHKIIDFEYNPNFKELFIRSNYIQPYVYIYKNNNFKRYYDRIKLSNKTQFIGFNKDYNNLIAIEYEGIKINNLWNSHIN